MILSSPAFAAGHPIPERYTADGDNISPPLEWQGLPVGTTSLALVCDDPDAPGGTFVHWVIYNIPVALKGLAEGVSPKPEPVPGMAQGKNDFGRHGYGGPSPPRGMHRYFFSLYALDRVLADCSDKHELLAAMRGHVLAESKMMGTYSRSGQ